MSSLSLPDGPRRFAIEMTSAKIDALSGYQPFAVARSLGSSSSQFFVRGTFESGGDAIVSPSDCLACPKEMDASRAILALPLASVLALWEHVGLELGEVAIWTAGSPLSALAGRVAIWRGACTAIELGPRPSPDGLTAQEFVDWSDAEAATTRLVTLTSGRPGFAAVDLSGRASVIDILLETIPTFGRLLLAGPAGDTLTIDYYKNVHRKGIVMSTTIVEPAQGIDPIAGTAVRAQLPRAFELLRNPATADQCRRLVGSADVHTEVTVGR